MQYATKDHPEVKFSGWIGTCRQRAGRRQIERVRNRRTAVCAYKFAMVVRLVASRGAIWWPFNVDWSIDVTRRRVQSRRRSPTRSLAHSESAGCSPARSRPIHYLRFQHETVDEWFMALCMLHLQGGPAGTSPSRIIHPGTRRRRRRRWRSR